MPGEPATPVNGPATVDSEALAGASPELAVAVMPFEETRLSFPAREHPISPRRTEHAIASKPPVARRVRLAPAAIQSAPTLDSGFWQPVHPHLPRHPSAPATSACVARSHQTREDTST
ncbi:hypothetical protein AcV5_010025 [Taiwanofungus camphoratus]|nr:hypothetical protein AcV5_010025 [Antrodia cinnamomea]